MATNTPEVEKIKERVYPTLLKGLTVLCKEKPDDPIRFLANWLIENNPYKPRAVIPASEEISQPPTVTSTPQNEPVTVVAA